MAWAPDYVTTAELAAFLRITDSVDDVQLALAITAASRAVDEHCDRQFGKVDAPAQRLYTPVWRPERGRWVARIDDLMSTTGLTVSVSAGTVDLYTLEPANAAADARPWTQLAIDPDAANQPTGDELNELIVVAPWGWTTTPPPVRQAVLLQASRFLARRDSPFGVAGSPDLGSEMRLLARVDADVAVSLRGYRRMRGAVA